MFMSLMATLRSLPLGFSIPRESATDRVFARITVVPSDSWVNTTCCPATKFIERRMSAGIVTCPLLVTVALAMCCSNRWGPGVPY
jgi:hypothetical protein